MKLPELPRLSEPGRYAGLYVVDFGDHTAVGYTAEEVAALLEHEQYREVKVYRIHRVTPAGELELAGVPAERFFSESAMLFFFCDPDAARDGYEALRTLAGREPPPGRAFVHLAELPGGDQASRWVVALVYPAEYEHDMGRWLLDAGYEAGDRVEGGISCATGYRELDKTIHARQQLWPAGSIASRPAGQVLAEVRKAVVR